MFPMIPKIESLKEIYIKALKRHPNTLERLLFLTCQMLQNNHIWNLASFFLAFTEESLLHKEIIPNRVRNENSQGIKG